jgi:hypothetical protein
MTADDDRAAYQPRLPQHPALYIADAAALKEYLRARGVNHAQSPDGVTLYVDIGEIVDYVIDVQWLRDQVRFIAVTPIDVDVAHQAAVALGIEQLNAAIGFPVWRLVPNLAAIYTATLNHDGTLSSRVFEYAVALLRQTLVRDQAGLRALAAG